MKKTIILLALSLLTFGFNTAWAVTPSATVTTVTVPTNGTYKIGDALTFTVNFDQNVIVTAQPSLQITLNTGGSVQANYVSGSGSTALVFSYTVVNGNLDADGIVVSSALSLNGGTIKNGSSIDAILTLNGVGATTGVLVDGVVPSPQYFSLSEKGNYLTSDVITVEFAYDENLIVTGFPSIIIIIGSKQVNAVYTSTSQGFINFKYTIQASDFDSDGFNINPTITLNGGTIKDEAGNDAHIYIDSSNGTHYSSTVNVGTTSVADANQTAKLSVYPNPTSDVIHLSSTEGIQNISITNLGGKIVWSGAASEFPLNVSSFAKGIYLVNVVTEGGVKTEKVIVK